MYLCGFIHSRQKPSHGINHFNVIRNEIFGPFRKITTLLITIYLQNLLKQTQKSFDLKIINIVVLQSHSAIISIILPMCFGVIFNCQTEFVKTFLCLFPIKDAGGLILILEQRWS